MGFGFPATGDSTGCGTSGGSVASDIAPIALASQARVPERQRIAVDRHTERWAQRLLASWCSMKESTSSWPISATGESAPRYRGS